MTGQWEQYVTIAAPPLDPDAFDKTDPQHDHWALDQRREIAEERVRKVLAIAGPLIAEDTRVRMVEAAAEIVKREGVEDAAIALLQDFIDPDPCWYDHHGYCQAHGWLDDDPACPHKRARELLAERGIEVES